MDCWKCRAPMKKTELVVNMAIHGRKQLVGGVKGFICTKCGRKYVPAEERDRCGQALGTHKK